MAGILDIRTLSLTSGIVSLSLSICMMYVLFARKTYPGFNRWVLASFSYALGMVGISLRGYIPDFFSIVIANTLIIFGNTSIAVGLETFLGCPKKRWICTGSNILIFTILLYATVISPNVTVRIVAISLIMAGVWFYCAYISHTYIPQYMKDKNILLTVIFSFESVWSIYRVIATVFLEPSIHNFMNSSGVQTLSVLVFIGGNIFVIVGLIVLSLQKLETELISAKEEIRKIQGIIPICSSCKKIRNDAGSWDQLELYFESHSDAEFSHSICPDCMKKLYPEYSIVSEKKRDL